MTQQKLKELPHGTKVAWIQFERIAARGYVVNLTKSKPKAEPPLIYIQWDDGQRTDGRDDWALEHASLDPDVVTA